MEWEQEVIEDLDTSGVDHEGGFSTLGLPDEIVAILTRRGITDPFPIQIAQLRGLGESGSHRKYPDQQGPWNSRMDHGGLVWTRLKGS